VARPIQGTQTPVIPPVTEASASASLDVAALEAELAAAEQEIPEPLAPAVVPSALESEVVESGVAEESIVEQEVSPGTETPADAPDYEVAPEPEPQVEEESQVVAGEQPASAPPAQDYQPVVPVYASAQAG